MPLWQGILQLKPGSQRTHIRARSSKSLNFVSSDLVLGPESGGPPKSSETVTSIDHLKVYQRGAVDYISVPIVPELLRARVVSLRSSIEGRGNCKLPTINCFA